MSQAASSIRSRLAMSAAALLLAANIVMPLMWGDVYPFTSAPMFRDAPVTCCQYRVLVNGQEQPAAQWRLQRIYDGNPIGYGVGIRPPEILEKNYGVIHDERSVRQHLEHQWTLPQHQHIESLEVVQEVLGQKEQTVGIIQTHRWQINRPKN